MAAVVLAAGRSSRMGGANKLLEALDGKPIVRRVVESALASRAHPVIVVTGHQAGEIETALAGCPATLVNNEDFAEGLSASLRRGLAALPAGVQGAVVCLGDMPRVSYRVINRLIDAFDPRFGRSIVVPTHRGRRGNPVLLGRQHFAEISALTGDVGAKPLVSRRSDETAEVAVAEEGVLIDVDTPEALDTVKAGG
ncbi:MAG: nucleotidyltransferase family protein [Kiloniellales bacterium]|nr:nucleotidyltransferase family protein [Kiloniellales bacterium]